MRRLSSVLFALLLGGLIPLANANSARAGTIVIKVASLRDVLLSKDPNPAIQQILKNNDVTVTVTDITGRVPVTLIPDMKINPDNGVIKLPNEPISVRVQVSCPGLRTVTLENVYNIDDAKNTLGFAQLVIVVMPLDDTPPPCCEPPVYRARHPLLRR